MHYRRITILAGAVLFSVFGASTASAQTFQNYRCADGTQFIAAFYRYDARAHLQLDGKAVTLKKRFSWSGARYSGSGITLVITKAGLTSLKHAGRVPTACNPT